MYRIFINEGVLILSSFETEFDALNVSESHEYSNVSILHEAIDKLQNECVKSIHLFSRDLDLMWEEFQSQFELVDAAGGLVLNSKSELLWIHRNACWDLPKGKVDSGELVSEAAVREVEEECSVKEIQRGELLGNTYHTYPYKGSNVLKTTYWFAMTCADEQNLKPQLEEGITDVVWASKAESKTFMKKTYSSIVELLRQERVQHFLGF